MSQPYLGSIEAFAFNYAPRGWLMCQSRLLPINQYQALFALLGTNYGGNGVQTFGLPDLRGRAALGFNGNYPIGATVGADAHTLTIAEAPSHSDLVNAQNNGTSDGSFVPTIAERLASGHSANVAAPVYVAGTPKPATVLLAPTSPNGGSTPHSNIMPYTAINYCIAISGLFPSRN